MTKDEIKARIEACRAELDGLGSGMGENSEPTLDAGSRRKDLEREIAGLEALLDES